MDPYFHLLRSNPVAIGTSTICKILVIIPFTSTGNLFPIRSRDRRGVTNAAEAVDNDVITMLKGAI